MYDIKIFLEKDWKFGARLNAGKEIVYGLWCNQKELMNDLKEWLSISYENKKKNENVSKLFSYLNSEKNDLLCH